MSNVIDLVQDAQGLKAALLVIQEALETGKWSKSFVIYNDVWIEQVMSKIAKILHEKYNIEVPDSEL